MIAMTLKCDFVSPCDVIEGNEYDVPCVHTNTNHVVPVMLPAHIDKNEFCLKSVDLHYHIDKRFQVPLAYHNSDAVLHSFVEDVSYIKLKAIKSHYIMEDARFENFNISYQMDNPQEIAKNRICPHQGTKITNSCGTCPAHGLKWNLETGEYRFKPPFYFQFTEDSPKFEFDNDDKKVVLIAHDDIEFNGVLIITDSNGEFFGSTEYETKYFLKKEDKFTVNCKKN